MSSRYPCINVWNLPKRFIVEKTADVYDSWSPSLDITTTALRMQMTIRKASQVGFFCPDLSIVCTFVNFHDLGEIFRFAVFLAVPFF